MSKSNIKISIKNNAVLSFSLIRANLGFSVGLFLLFLVGTIVIVVSNMVPNSVSASVNTYLNDYQIPHGTVTTELIDSSNPDISNIEGIKEVESDIVYDTTIKYDSNTLKQTRVFGIEENGLRKFHYYESCNQSNNEHYLWITNHFANITDLHAGDYIDVKIEDKYENFVISAIVTCPEAMSCTYDSTSWNESNDFAYVYIPKQILDDYLPVKNMSNLKAILFNDDLNLQQKRDALKNAENKLGSDVIETSLYEDSKTKANIDSDVKSLVTSCSIFPLVMFVILILCSSLFLYQIVNRQRKRIGLLKALGYSKQKIIMHYICFFLIIIIAACIIGSIASAFIGKYVVDSFKSIFDIPTMTYVISLNCYIYLILMVLAGLLSCIWSSLKITKIDPSEAYASSISVTKPYKFKLPIFNKVNSITKFCLAKIFGKKGRTLATCIGLSACFVVTFCSIAAFHAKTEGINYIFNSRYKYDYLVGYDENSTFLEELKKIDAIDKVEPFTVILDTIDYNNSNMSLQVQTYTKDISLIELIDSDGNDLCPTDGVVFEENFANLLNLAVGDYVSICGKQIKIEALAREYANIIQYVSPQTAAMLDYEKSNACVFTANSSLSDNEVLEKVSDIKGFKQLKIKAHQKQAKEESQLILDMVFYILIAAGLFIGLIIILNMIIINVNERKFEYATLIALGTDKFRFRRNILLENSILFIIALAISVIPSYWLADLILDSINNALQEFPFIHIPDVYIQSTAISCIYIICGIFYTMHRIKNINPSIELNING